MKGRIFLTGGTGSLGQALLRRADREGWDCQFTVYSRDEVKQGELRALYPRHRFVLGDVRDADWLEVCVRGHDAIVHAAAYKQVPAAEVNAGEAIKTNVLGSLNVAMAAVRAEVPRVLGVSTDKACAPVNLYGESKACMEKLFQQACQWGRTDFTLIRYGNVLGSRGSVVPLFRKQAAERGEITITDASMTRFWMTLDQAVDLVVKGLDIPRGSIMVPKCPASTMEVLAKAVAPGTCVRVIGIRPGEKMHEQLVHRGEALHTFEHAGYFIITPASSRVKGSMEPSYEYRSDTARQLTVEELRRMLDG